MSISDGIGARVAEERKLRGMKQHQLANRMHMSLALIKKVEQGKAPASPAFVSAAARALGVTVPDLYDQPAPRFGTERSNVDALETAIMEGPAAVVAINAPPPALSELASQVAEVQRLQRYSHYRASSAVMPDILRHLHLAAEMAPSGVESERAHFLLATLYECALICLHRLGSLMCGWAAERATAAAQLSGDPLLIAEVGAGRGLPLMHRGSYSVAERFYEEGQRMIADEKPTAPTLAVRGDIYLRSAILAARRGDRSTSDAYLAEARDLARFVPSVDYEHSDYYDTAFSATNVEIHSVAAAVEMADGTTAITRAENLVFPSGTMRSRMGHHYIDVARAWLLHGDHNRAMFTLQLAKRTTPQQTRYHPMVHETYRAVARKKRRSEEVARFGAWLGLMT